MGLRTSLRSNTTAVPEWERVHGKRLDLVIEGPHTDYLTTSFMVRLGNIIGVMIASRENWASVANYVERILRLKKRDLEAAEYVDVPCLENIGTHVRRYTKQGRKE